MNKSSKCPFCKSDKTCMESSGGLSFWVECDSCETRGPVSFSEVNAIELWNKRPDITLKMRGKIKTRNDWTDSIVFLDTEGLGYPISHQIGEIPAEGQYCTAIVACIVSEDNEVLPMLVMRFVDED